MKRIVRIKEFEPKEQRGPNKQKEPKLPPSQREKMTNNCKITPADALPLLIYRPQVVSLVKR